MMFTSALLLKSKVCLFMFGWIGVFLFLLATPTSVQAVSPQPTGFRTWYWGQLRLQLAPAEEWSVDPTLPGSTSDEATYKKKQEDPMIAGVGPFDIRYVFWQDQFAEMHAYTKGADQYNCLVEATRKVFGKKPKREILDNYERLTWKKDTTEISIVFWGNYDNNQVHLSMKSLAIEKDKKTWQKNEEKKKKTLLQRGW